MNGIDLLFVVISLFILWCVWEAVAHYQSWSAWDRDRRHERKRARLEFNDRMREEDYRLHLRAIFQINQINKAFTKISATATTASESFAKFSEKLTTFNKLDVETSQKKHTI